MQCEYIYIYENKQRACNLNYVLLGYGYKISLLFAHLGIYHIDLINFSKLYLLFVYKSNNIYKIINILHLIISSSSSTLHTYYTKFQVFFPLFLSTPTIQFARERNNFRDG